MRLEQKIRRWIEVLMRHERKLRKQNERVERFRAWMVRLERMIEVSECGVYGVDMTRDDAIDLLETMKGII